MQWVHSAEALALRNIYLKVKNKARIRHEMENAELIASSFFHDPRPFWRDFKGKPDICPISDTTRWTNYFKGLVGTPDTDPTNSNNNNNKRPLTPKSMPPAGDEHAKLKT